PGSSVRRSAGSSPTRSPPRGPAWRCCRTGSPPPRARSCTSMVGTTPSGPDRAMAYDAFLLVSFGGPEGPDDVLPFLENVTRGRDVPPERLASVAEHYYAVGGVSPINQQCRDLLAAIRTAFPSSGLSLPVYWGNRNWTP